MQFGAEEFIRDFIEIFSDCYEAFEYNRYYMSIPLEYYLQYSLDNDRLMFKNLEFDDNGYKIFKVVDFLKEEEKNYNHFYNLRRNEKKDDIGLVDLPIERRKRLLYYLLFNRRMLAQKFNDKFNDMSDSPKAIRRLCYCLLKDKKRLLNALKRKK